MARRVCGTAALRIRQALHMTAEERGAFASDEEPADAGDDGLEDFLLSMEDEEKRLQARVESTSKIFDLLARRGKILADRDEMRAAKNDPSRLGGKGKGAGLRLQQELANARLTAPFFDTRR